MRQDTAWLELLEAMEHLAAEAPRPAADQMIKDWCDRYHDTMACGCVVAEPKHATNRVAEQLRGHPDHAMFLYRDDATRDSIERALDTRWPSTLRTVVLVNAGGDQPVPTHVLYRENMMWFMAERVPGIKLRRVPNVSTPHHPI